MAFSSAYLHLTLVHSEGQGMHISTLTISQTMTYEANIAIVNIWEVARGLSMENFHLT